MVDIIFYSFKKENFLFKKFVKKALNVLLQKLIL